MIDPTTLGVFVAALGGGTAFATFGPVGVTDPDAPEARRPVLAILVGVLVPIAVAVAFQSSVAWVFGLLAGTAGAAWYRLRHENEDATRTEQWEVASAGVAFGFSGMGVTVAAFGQVSQTAPVLSVVLADVGLLMAAFGGVLFHSRHTVTPPSHATRP